MSDENHAPEPIAAGLYEADFGDDQLLPLGEDGLFARDYNGQLVRMDKVTAADFESQITIKIDGRDVTVPKAVPLTDSQGKLVRDSEGRPIPRATTIFDAATKAYADEPHGNPIPILCHQEHLEPVGACRVCCVEIAKVKREHAAGAKVIACLPAPRGRHDGGADDCLARPRGEKAD